MKTKQTKPKISPIAALYERISREDEAAGNSTSIVNQKKKLEQYAVRHGFKNFIHYTDDGYSGTSFERPAWKKLMEDIHEGKVSTLITKDLSRIGRNYLEVGLMTEVILPDLDVRFIAIDNGVDSANPSSMEYLPIINLINDRYVRDVSDRMKAALKAKRIAGLHTASRCRYGYKKDEQNPEKWVIDEPAASVVRHIFQLALDGKKPSAIAQILYTEKAEKPSYYWMKHYAKNQSNLPKRPYDWDVSTIRDMLTSREYIGWTVNRKTSSLSYKKRMIQKLDRSEWQFIEGTQEPIINEDIFNQVQTMLTTSHPSTPFSYTNPLKGLVFCSDCGQPMSNKRQKGFPLRNSKGELSGSISKPLDCFECRTYKIAKTHHEDKCTRHYIPSKALHLLILDILRGYADLALKNENLLLKMIENGSSQENTGIKTIRQELNRKQKRSGQLDDLIQGAYEANFKGDISDKRLAALISKYEAEQEVLDAEISESKVQFEQMELPKTDSRQFLKRLKKFTDFDTLTHEMVAELVEKVIVYERTGQRGNYEQNVEIYLKFAGKVECTTGKGGANH